MAGTRDDLNHFAGSVTDITALPVADARNGISKAIAALYDSRGDPEKMSNPK